MELDFGNIPSYDVIYDEVQSYLTPAVKAANDYWMKETNNLKDDSSIENNEELRLLLYNHMTLVITTWFEKVKDATKKEKDDFRERGHLYESFKSRTKKELAALMRSEIKIYFPDAKVSVTSDYNSIDIRIKDIGYNPFANDYRAFLMADGDPQDWINQDIRNRRERGVFNDQFLEDLKHIEKIHKQYNFDNSDAMTDYFHVNYYGNVRADTDDLIVLYYPQITYSVKRRMRAEEWDLRTLISKVEADILKTVILFKKYQAAILKIRATSKKPEQFLYVVITKVPNGQSRFPSYSADVLVEASKVRYPETYEKYHTAKKPTIFIIKGQKYYSAGSTYSSVSTYDILPITDDPAHAAPKVDLVKQQMLQQKLEVLKLSLKIKYPRNPK
jgi:hypothetical protein